MLDLDLNLLANLSALLQTRSVSHAARRRGMSQPAMSRSLAELRRLLDDPLLVRTRGGMMLTRRAEELAAPLRGWLDEAERLVMRPCIDPAALDRTFRIAASAAAARAVLGPVLPVLADEAPRVSVAVRTVTDAVAALAAGEVDLAIGATEPDRRLVHERHVLSEALLCVVRPGHPLAAKREGQPVALDALQAWPAVAIGVGEDRLDPLAAALRARGLEPRVAAELPCPAAARDLLARSDAVMVLPERAARDEALAAGLSLFAAPPELGRANYWLTWHTRGHRDPALQWLIDVLAEGVCMPAAPLLAAAE